MKLKPWTVRPTSGADRDLVKILQRTLETFGTRQAKIYENTLFQALRELRTGPYIPGARLRDDLGPGIRTLHVARKGRKGRHFIVYRIGGDHIIDVLRLLHDGMDLPSQLSP